MLQLKTCPAFDIPISFLIRSIFQSWCQVPICVYIDRLRNCSRCQNTTKAVRQTLIQLHYVRNTAIIAFGGTTTSSKSVLLEWMSETLVLPRCCIIDMGNAFVDMPSRTAFTYSLVKGNPLVIDACWVASSHIQHDAIHRETPSSLSATGPMKGIGTNLFYCLIVFSQLLRSQTMALL